jgi:hypothetical protein
MDVTGDHLVQQMNQGEKKNLDGDSSILSFLLFLG